jgi:hypothetical protein
MLAPAAVAVAAAVVSSHGVSLRVPSGWRTLSRPLTSCVDPIERLDVAGPDGALVMVQEALDRRYVSRFPARPAHFAVHGPPQSLTCCGASGHGKGWLVHFRDGGRSFYVYLYPGRGGSPTEALHVLNGLRVEPVR